MAKQYERDEDAEQAKKKTLQKEAKRLAQFLEDYDDDRDDSKYYR
jgi:RNA-binding protein 25